MSHKISDLIATVTVNFRSFMSEHGKKVTQVFAVIGLIVVAGFIIIKMWPFIKFMLGLAALGLIAGGWCSRK